MTQQKDIIQSGQQTLRAYNDGGVKTPASGLEEWIMFNGMVNPLNINNFTIQLKPLPFPIFLDSITVYFDANPEENKTVFIAKNFNFLNHANFTTENELWQYWMKFNHPVSPEDRLIFNSDAPLASKINYVELRGYRIAYDLIDGNFGDA